MIKKEGMINYNEELNRRYWKYQQEFFPNIGEYFERSFAPDGRPPVFYDEKAEYNVIVKPSATKDENNRLINLIKKGKRHKWFRSMNSSQALAQSVFGNLAVYNNLVILTNMKDDSGLPLMGESNVESHNFYMEHEIGHLGEPPPRPTSLDGFFDGKYQVAIECKFTEGEVGHCLNSKGDHCNGNYTKQTGRVERCTKTENGAKYWEYIPELFKWKNDTDLTPCPLNKNYQLVRNILAVCVRPDGDVSPENGHMILIYDERNPAFQKGGKGFSSIEETRQSLEYPNLLRTCSWQSITKHLRTKDVLPWLTKELELKYGL